MKILFLVQHLGQPRCVKRINAIAEAGIPVEVYGFDRGMYSENMNYPPGIVKHVVHSDQLGRKDKILAYIRMARLVAGKAQAGDVLYTFGFELATAVRTFTRARYIYENADVVAARQKSRILKWIDKRNLQRARLVVMTSEGFIQYFYGKHPSEQAVRNIELLPNKLHPYFRTQQRPSHVPVDGKIRLGFVGAFRYLNILRRMARLIGEQFPNMEFHFFGDGDADVVSEIETWSKSYANVFLHGRFVNPSGLAEVYDQIDVNFVCYDTHSGNARIAEPNKLYESIYFGKPVIASKHTFFGEKVERLGIGTMVDADKEEDLCRLLQSLTPEKVEEWRRAEYSIETDSLIDDERQLIARL